MIVPFSLIVTMPPLLILGNADIIIRLSPSGSLSFFNTVASSGLFAPTVYLSSDATGARFCVVKMEGPSFKLASEPLPSPDFDTEELDVS